MAIVSLIFHLQRNFRSMKHIQYTIFIIIALCSLHCSNPFDKEFQHIEDYYVRTLSMTCVNKYKPLIGDAAPGDTIIINAYYAGEKVHNSTWKMSIIGDAYYNHMLANFTNECFNPIETISFCDSISHLRIHDSTLHHDRVSLSVIVPENCIETCKNISDSWLTHQYSLKTINDSIINSITRKNATELIYRSLSIDSIFFLGISPDSSHVATILGDLPNIEKLIHTYSQTEKLPYFTSYIHMLQIFVSILQTQIVIYSQVNLVYRSGFRINIRYNSIFRSDALKKILGQAFNPVIWNIALSKIKGEHEHIGNKPVNIQYLLGPDAPTDTISVQSGYSYFLSAMKLQSDDEPLWTVFYSRPLWLFSNDTYLPNVASEQLVQIPYYQNWNPKLIPPAHTGMKMFTIWHSVDLYSKYQKLYQTDKTLYNQIPTFTHGFFEGRGVFKYDNK